MDEHLALDAQQLVGGCDRKSRQSYRARASHCSHRTLSAYSIEVTEKSLDSRLWHSPLSRQFLCNSPM